MWVFDVTTALKICDKDGDNNSCQDVLSHSAAGSDVTDETFDFLFPTHQDLVLSSHTHGRSSEFIVYSDCETLACQFM